MLTYEQFAEAARNIDAVSEERGLNAALEYAGVDPQVALRVADQRALRMTLILTHDRNRLRRLAESREPSVVRLTGHQQMLKANLTAVYLDGMATASKAAKDA